MLETATDTKRLPSAGSFDRQIAAADYLIRARRMIDDDTAGRERHSS